VVIVGTESQDQVHIQRRTIDARVRSALFRPSLHRPDKGTRGSRFALMSDSSFPPLFLAFFILDYQCCRVVPPG